MRRRSFLGWLGGAAAMTPSLAFSRENKSPTKRLGILTMNSSSDPIYKSRIASVEDGLASFGWKIGVNLQVDWRFAGDDPPSLPRYADELIALSPDAILAINSPCVKVLKQRTQSIPIIFTLVTDPVGQGFVETFRSPAGM